MRLFAFFILFILLFGCASQQTSSDSRVETKKESVSNEVVNMKITSPVFSHGANIPKKYTCDAQDISPPLKIEGVPSNAKSLVLIVDDPDAPAKIWLHWTVWNIPADTKEISEGAKIGVEGLTDFGTVGYGGPCPPSGTHTYRFKLYALDKMLVLEQGATLAQLEVSMKGHVIAQAELDGEYKRG